MSTSTMSISKLIAPLAIAGALLMTTAVGAAEARSKNGAKNGGLCGVNSYRQDGKCLDARAKDGKTWMEKALAKPAWTGSLN